MASLILIDINSLPCVFNGTNSKYKDFSAVKKWIDKGLGIIVFGGSKYRKELHKCYCYLKLLNEYNKQNKVKMLEDSNVDQIEDKIKKITKNTDCDDQHIMAILFISKTTLLCTTDKRSHSFVKDKKNYPGKIDKVKIYSSLKNRNLLK